MRTARWMVLCFALPLGVAGCGNNNNSGDLGADLGAPDQAVDAAPMDLAASDGLSSGDAAPDALMCTANAFVSCNGNIATFCNGTGDGTVDIDCGAPCTSGGCGQCTADTCSGGTLTPCDTAHGKTGAPTSCVTLKAGGDVSQCNTAGTACAQCTGSFVCGSGTIGTANTQYACNADGTLGTATACAFGCDPDTGKCRDMVPANQATQHLAGGDTFTCNPATASTLAAVSAMNGTDVIAVDTTAQTFTLNGTAVANVNWGAAYSPTGATGGSTVRVAHIRSLTMANGAQMNVTGSSSLILLVDEDVNLSGGGASQTIINAAANKRTTAGPGAITPNTAQGGTAGTQTFGGGGGAGHATAGAAGGKGGGGGGGGAAGAMYGSRMVLEGGATGGSGDLTTAGTGGFGGGGLQMSACGNVTIGTGVVINASGGGGGGGTGNVAVSGNGGGAGGSGGTVILEAGSFNIGATLNTVSGKLAANGGGGGSGGGIPGTAGGAAPNGNDGSNWDVTGMPSTAAVGGTALKDSNGNSTNNGGGTGGTSTAPTTGGSAATGFGGGGGGGAAGRIFINRSPLLGKPTLSAASPTPDTSIVCVSGAGSDCTYDPTK